ncbi:MAG: hypothetical protein M3R02_24235, partial [Chloroflexota bacterium]|nr:hypothetical protein [Chloroflexota bacterium]
SGESGPDPNSLVLRSSAKMPLFLRSDGRYGARPSAKSITCSSALAAAGDPRIVDAAGVEDLEGDATEAATLAHSAGVRFGVAAEQLRQALLAGGEG